MTTYYKAIEKRLKILIKESNHNYKLKSTRNSNRCLLTPLELDRLDVIAFHKATKNDLLFCKIISDMLTQNFLVSNDLKNYMIAECKSLDSFEYIFSILSSHNAEIVLSKLSKKCHLLPVYFPSNLTDIERQNLQYWYSRILPTMTVSEIREAQIPLDNTELNIIADSLGVWDNLECLDELDSFANIV
jgi:tRNA(Ile)-lysidine synthase TilS/MesJ